MDLSAEQIFIAECKPFINKIENYSGNNPIEPWYNYLLWLDNRYETPMDESTIFVDILMAFLQQFDCDPKYKQDRRLVKALMKFVSCSVNLKTYSLFHNILKRCR